MSQAKPPQSRRWQLPVLGVLLVGIVLLAGLRQQAIQDWLKLRGYTPPQQISQLAVDDTMTAKSKHLYFINHPVLRSRTSFSKYCPSGTEQSVVLGCYKSVQNGIHLLDVSNPELAGIEQVTAAHEMLHAAYDRLGARDRRNVDAMLSSYYNSSAPDETTRETIEAYKKTEPNDVVNEMHSIFGTQVAKLPAGLEAYYQQYFASRSKVTDYYQQYQAAFTTRQAQIKDFDIQLGTLKAKIDDLQPAVEKQQSDLQSQRAQLDNERSNPSAYNAAVADYNRLVNSYNTNVRTLKAQIDQYNDIVKRRNNIALEEQQLVQAITAPAVTK